MKAAAVTADFSRTPGNDVDLRLRTSPLARGFHHAFDECPWMRTDPGCANQFMLFDLARNEFATLFRIDPGCAIPPHYHCSPVIGHVLQGAFRYLEAPWIARQGATVYEPAGEVHTLTCVGDEPMIGFFFVTGPHITVDERGHRIGWGDAFSTREWVLQWCADNGHDPSFVDRITRGAAR